ncbi:MAG: nitronate monooxygenase [Deltaproteobacteria bacterium]|nr:nitronate monooxygenase [Deltaproteobacteria bacterium]
MFETKITKMLGIQYPIIGGTMMSISTADFVAAISNAGGLGILASVIYKSKEEFAEAVDRIQELTEKPFAVNINLFPAMRVIDNNEYIDVMVEKGVKVVETSGHSAPEDLCKRFKDAGMTWIHKCVGVRYALKAQGLGADIITVVGYENGGATGKLDLGTLVLVTTVVDAVNVPVIGGGGISDGRGLSAVLSLGASAVIIGTLLLVTKECPIHNKLKESFVNASELDTMLIMRSIGATHRVWTNTAAQKCAEVETGGGGFEEVLNVVSGEKSKMMYDTGDLDAGIISLGQGIGLVHDIPTVKELFDRIMSQATEVVEQLKAS